MLKSLTCSMFVALASITGVVGATEPPGGAGFRLIQLPDPVTQQPMQAAVFYPAAPTSETTRMGAVVVSAVKDAAPRGVRHPLVLLSHGNGAGRFSHHDTATFLARHGYVVAAIEHPGDNFRDSSGVGTDRVLMGRALQLSALLDFLLQAPASAGLIDSRRVGVAGFSAGGYSALLLMGAKPKFELLGAYCKALPTSVLCAGGAKVSLSSPPLIAKTDDRVRAAFVMSPPGAFFDRESLSQVSKPVSLYAAGADSVLPVKENAIKVKELLPSLARYTEIPGADHFVFLAPCTSEMRGVAPALCTDPQGVNRAAVHDNVNRDALMFFQEQLQVDASFPKRM